MCRAPELAIYREIMKGKMRYDVTAIYYEIIGNDYNDWDCTGGGMEGWLYIDL